MKVIVIYTGELLQTWEISRTYCILMMIGSFLVFFQKPAEIQQALRVNMIIYIYISLYICLVPPLNLPFWHIHQVARQKGVTLHTR